MLSSWKSVVVVGFVSYWVYSHQHALKAQLLSKDLPRLYDAGAECSIVKDKHANTRFKFCEDGVVVSPGISIFSCDPGRLKWNTVMGPMIDPNPRGGLWAVHYDSNSVTQGPYRLDLNYFSPNVDFHPLGIEVTPSAEEPRVLVINHKRDGPTIEVFRIYFSSETGMLSLEYENTLQHPSITAPNAISAVSDQAFILSQDHRFTYRLGKPLNMFLPLLETFFALPLGRVNLVEFDTVDGIRKVHTLKSGIPFANGVALSDDSSTLAVASTNRAEVQLYAWNQNSIEYVRAIKVPFGPDNIAFAGDSLLVAGHPHLPSFMAVKKGKTHTSPSWVSSIAPAVFDETGAGEDSWISRVARGARVSDILKSDGSFLTSSSGAFADMDMETMFVVGLYDGNGVAKCRVVT
ncbi:arylesterase domain-containing protein [Ceratobasidium sp. AG-Ba]|nr:arylesterase domain-containing protein [Ceratobasidium sp. AG-Ba]